MDFDRSEAIQGILASLHHDNSSDIIRQHKQLLRDGLTEALAGLDSNLADVRRETTDAEIAFRSDAEVLYSDLKEHHVEELTSLFEREHIATLKEEQRNSAEFRALTAQAMSFAAGDDVEAARQTKLAADRSRDEGLARRLTAVRASFARLFKQAHKRQLGELMALQEEFRKRIEGIARAGDERVGAEQRKTAVFMETQLRRAISDAADHIMKQSERSRIATELGKCMTTFLRERNREFLMLQ
jgi:hypothetical protein